MNSFNTTGEEALACPENSTEVTLSCGVTGCLSVRDNQTGEWRQPTKRELELVKPQLESVNCN